ncbi:MAG: hypothetical protein ACREL7_03220 [Longimicrobiales bacterium]
MKRSAALVLAVSAIAACGDPPTPDPRGYTRNILERTGLIVRGQAVTEMDRLGNPAMPDTSRIVLPDSTPSD